MSKSKLNAKYFANRNVIKRISEEIIKMADDDLKMRRQYLKTGKWQSEVDKRNTKRMKQIVKKYGWPTAPIFDKKISTMAWLIVQHADSDPGFQQQCLDLIKKKAVQNSSVDRGDIAYLTDRVRVNRGSRQLFGTQFYIHEGKIVPRPIWDEKNLEKRRTEFNLQPFKIYKKDMENMYRGFLKNSSS